MADFPAVADSMPILQAMEEVAAILTAGGVRTALDVADLNPPAVLLLPNTVDYDTLAAADYELTLDLVLIAPGVPSRAALDVLDVLVTKVRALFRVGELRAVGYQLSNLSPDPLPAFQTSVAFAVSPTPTEEG